MRIIKHTILSFFLALGLMGASCSENTEVLVPIKPNLPKVDKAQKGSNSYESLINLLQELDNHRAKETSYQ